MELNDPHSDDVNVWNYQDFGEHRISTSENVFSQREYEMVWISVRMHATDRDCEEKKKKRIEHTPEGAIIHGALRKKSFTLQIQEIHSELKHVLC